MQKIRRLLLINISKAHTLTGIFFFEEMNLIPKPFNRSIMYNKNIIYKIKINKPQKKTTHTSKFKVKIFVFPVVDVTPPT